MLWRPVRGGNAFEITVARLAQAIRLGLVEVGERLPPERELAERLQVSRVTLREAIGALREAGLLESRRGRSGGTFVVRAGEFTGRPAPTRPLSPARWATPLHDALDFRRVLEPGAAALAATPDPVGRRPGSARRLPGRVPRAASRTAPGQRLAAAPGDRRGERLDRRWPPRSPTSSSRLDRLLAAIPVIRRNLDHSDAQHDRHRRRDPGAATPAVARAAMEEHCDGTADAACADCSANVYGMLSRPLGGPHGAPR